MIRRRRGDLMLSPEQRASASHLRGFFGDLADYDEPVHLHRCHVRYHIPQLRGGGVTRARIPQKPLIGMSSSKKVLCVPLTTIPQKKSASRH